MQIISTYWFLSSGYLHNWLIHVHAICSSTYMYMKNVNGVTGWLSQTTDSSKYLSGPLDFEIKRVACILRLLFLSFQSPGAEADLENSLYLVEEIDELTKKMMTTVGGELAKYKGRKDFGSSVW